MSSSLITLSPRQGGAGDLAAGERGAPHLAVHGGGGEGAGGAGEGQPPGDGGAGGGAR